LVEPPTPHASSWWWTAQPSKPGCLMAGARDRWTWERGKVVNGKNRGSFFPRDFRATHGRSGVADPIQRLRRQNRVGGTGDLLRITATGPAGLPTAPGERADASGHRGPGRREPRLALFTPQRRRHPADIRRARDRFSRSPSQGPQGSAAPTRKRGTIRLQFPRTFRGHGPRYHGPARRATYIWGGFTKNRSPQTNRLRIGKRSVDPSNPVSGGGQGATPNDHVQTAFRGGAGRPTRRGRPGHQIFAISGGGGPQIRRCERRGTTTQDG